MPPHACPTAEITQPRTTRPVSPQRNSRATLSPSTGSQGCAWPRLPILLPVPGCLLLPAPRGGQGAFQGCDRDGLMVSGRDALWGFAATCLPEKAWSCSESAWPERAFTLEPDAHPASRDGGFSHHCRAGKQRPAGIQHPEVPAGIQHPAVPAGIQHPAVPAGIQHPAVLAGIQHPAVPAGARAQDCKPGWIHS